MRVVGVRLPDGSAVWADAGETAGLGEIAPRDTAVVQVGGEVVRGEVFVLPEQLVGAPPPIDGHVLEFQGRVGVVDGDDPLPGADMPYLGGHVAAGGVEGTVVAIDPVRRTAVVRDLAGVEIEAPAGTLRAGLVTE